MTLSRSVWSRFAVRLMVWLAPSYTAKPIPTDYKPTTHLVISVNVMYYPVGFPTRIVTATSVKPPNRLQPTTNRPLDWSFRLIWCIVRFVFWSRSRWCNRDTCIRYNIIQWKGYTVLFLMYRGGGMNFSSFNSLVYFADGNTQFIDACSSHM